MNHYVYEITNLINGKKYIGKRSCHCPIEDDKYMGSGKLIKKAHKKYGIENFKKNVLYICESDALAYAKEKELIESVEAWNNDMYYNLDGGGRGTGSGKAHPLYGTHLSEDRKEKLRQINLGKKHTEETKLKISIANKGRQSPNKGKKLSESTKLKIANAHRGKTISLETKKLWSKQRSGEGNSMFGTHRFGSENPMYGKSHSEETKSKISSRLKGKNLGKDNHKSVSVALLNTGEVFESINIASKKFNVSSGNIYRCCNKDGYKYAGTLNGEKLVWMFLNEYRNLNNKEIGLILSQNSKRSNSRKVISLNNKQIFETIKEAGLKYNIPPNNISKNCKGKSNYAGKINGEPARWMYY